MKHVKKVSKTAPSTAQIWTWPSQLLEQKAVWLGLEPNPATGDYTTQFSPILGQVK